ncbi:unnamed protein product [Paramecium sonneborni]|uniref:3-oxo-5-alpha-steroid 4-dehydrogenase C-terminal domain-containing protein n=1 Tax=Paramecium sonneborni TaxID=65129 RepID=A0A8S1MJQ3_9CILI|nr:unnamed protein product [Paramecium sonneborni]
MSDQLTIKRRRGNNIDSTNYIITLNLQDSSSTLLSLKQEISKITKIKPLRQWLTSEDLKTVYDDNTKPLNLCGFKSGQVLVVKDLGPQMLWITVFYAEYVGPILMFALLYYLGKKDKYTFMQKSALWMVAAHYIKRILETKFVHVFSRDSMPTKRALINCFHYWILCGACIGSELYLFRTFKEDPAWKKVFIALFAGFEFLNLMCHLRLASFRKQPAIKKNDESYVALNKQRQIPYGWGFGRISSANYFWETMAWVSFTIFTGSYAAIGFTAFSFSQMMIWAKQKHKRYLKEFGDKYPKNRKAIVPFII